MCVRSHMLKGHALDRQPEDGRQARRIAGSAGQEGEGLRIALDLGGQQRRRQVLLDVELVDRAELEVPVGAVDVLELAELLDFGQPGSQIKRVRGHEFRTTSVIILSTPSSYKTKSVSQ